MSRAAVVGAGPNGLAAAVVLARAGVAVELFETNATIGGGARSEDFEGAIVDWGSAVHPMALASPFMQQFGLAERTPFAIPDASYAHPLADRSIIAWRDIDRMEASLPRQQARAWQRLLRPLSERMSDVSDSVLSSMLRIPPHPVLLARFGMRVLAHGTPLGDLMVGDDAAAALSGVFAHSVSPLPRPAAAAAGLVLAAAAHAGGWPIPIGGTQVIADAMLTDVLAHGGIVHRNHRVRTLAELTDFDAVILDVSPHDLLDIAQDSLHPGYARALRRYRYGDAASRVDFVLNEPVPWRDAETSLAGTVHLGGAAKEIAAAERDVASGRHPVRPYVLVSQPSIFDRSRAPEGRHTLWTYAHVPAGSDVDMTEAITRQFERFAPGFRDTIVHSRATVAQGLERANANVRGGDIANGRVDLRGLLMRPVLSSEPWRAGKGLYLCSAATVPGPGVHGMGGYHAARLALRDVFGTDSIPALSPDRDADTPTPPDSAV